MGMSSIIGALRVVFGADTAAFEHGTRRATREMRRTERQFKKTAQKITAIGKGMSLAMTAPLVAIGVTSFNTAADVAELESAFDVTFKGAAKNMREWSQETGDILGRSTQEIQASAVAFASLFNKAFDPAQANKMTKQFAVLTQDLASFKNLSNEVAQQKLFSGLTGESEPLKAVGVFINETAVSAKALELNLQKVNGKYTDQQKIVARAALIQEQLVEAQGDVIRTSDSTVNQIKRSKAAWQELQVLIGNRLIPVITPLIGKFGDLITSFTNLSPTAQKFIVVGAGVLAVIGPIVTAVGGLISILAPAAAAVSVLTAAVGTGAGLGLVGSLTLLLGPVALLAAGIVLLNVAIETSGEAAKKAKRSFDETRKIIGDYNTTQNDLEKDTATLKTKTDELNKAIKTSGTAAQDAARLEIDAIRKRIEKNKELRRVYLDDMKLQLQKSKEIAARADTKSLAMLTPWHTDKTGAANKIERKDGFKEKLEGQFKEELNGYRAMIDAGDTLTKKDRKRFQKINDYFRERSDRAHEILDLEKQIAAISAPTKTVSTPPPPGPVVPDKPKDPPKTTKKKKGDDPVEKSRKAAKAARDEAKATLELAAALAVNQREYDITVASQDLLRSGVIASEADIRAMAVATVDANFALDEARQKIKDKAEADQLAADKAKAHTDAELEKVRVSDALKVSIEQEIIDNARLAAAMQISRYEYDVTAASISIMASGLAGTSAEARKLAEDLVASRGSLDTARDGMNEAEAAAEKLKKKLDATGMSGVQAFQGMASAFDQMARGLKSGNIIDALSGILGMLDKIGGITGGFKIAGLSFGGARKGGGNTYGGKTYLVGEEGPELFTSQTSGTIVPNHKLAAGGNDFNVYVDKSPFFEATVDKRSRAQAQPIAVATTLEGVGQVQKKSAYDAGRSLL